MGDPKAALFRGEEEEVEEKPERSKFLTVRPVILGKRSFQKFSSALYNSFPCQSPIQTNTSSTNHTNTLHQQEILIEIYIAFC